MTSRSKVFSPEWLEHCKVICWHHKIHCTKGKKNNTNWHQVILNFYDAEVTLNMYLYGITQTIQIHKLLLNCMMICVSFSLRFCVKRLLNSSMSAKVNIGSYCKFYVCYTNWRNEVLLSGTESNKSIDNSTPVFGQMDSGDMLLLTWWSMLKIFWLDWWKWSNGMSARILQTFTGLVWRCGVLPSETVDNGWTEN